MYYKTDWIWEPPVYFREEPEMINNLKQQFLNVAAALDKSKTATANLIWRVGLQQLEKDPEVADKIDGKKLIVCRLYNELIEKEAEEKRLQKIFIDHCHSNPDKWLLFCSENEIDCDTRDRIMRQRTFLRSNRRDIAVAFVKGLLSNGEPHSTNEIRSAASAAGIISEDKNDWAWLRQIANEQGWSKNADHGEWSL